AFQAEPPVPKPPFFHFSFKCFQQLGESASRSTLSPTLREQDGLVTARDRRAAMALYALGETSGFTEGRFTRTGGPAPGGCPIVSAPEGCSQRPQNADGHDGGRKQRTLSNRQYAFGRRHSRAQPQPETHRCPEQEGRAGSRALRTVGETSPAGVQPPGKIPERSQ